MRSADWGLACAVLVSSAVSPSATANDVLPRLFTNVPVGMNFLRLGYTRSEGNVSVDPSLALDVDAELDTYLVSYSRSFGLFGQSSIISASLPYADLTLTGIVQGERVSASGDERPDPSFRLAMNLTGAPALTREEFRHYRQKTIVGLNLEVMPPWGDYDSSRVVNFGSNRWTVSPGLGISHRMGRFTLEGSGTLIFFSDNNEYLIDGSLSQETIATVRATLLYHFPHRPGTWVGLSGLYLNGGETTIDGEDRNDLQSNSRLGAALSWPFGRRHNLLFKISAGVTTRIGADFNNYQVIYTFAF
jgi:hypothetical protein